MADEHEPTALEQSGITEVDYHRVRADRDRLAEETRRLRRICIADGLDPDMPIFPGKNLELMREVERLKAGQFTDQELQNLCHGFSEHDKEAFCAGCEEYQTKLFGESPIALLRLQIAELTHYKSKLETRNAAKEREIELLTAELDNLKPTLEQAQRLRMKAQDELAELRKEMEAVQYAAHMPDDYEFGLPSWINQRLYACWIGAIQSPHCDKQTVAFIDEIERYRERVASLTEDLARAEHIAQERLEQLQEQSVLFARSSHAEEYQRMEAQVVGLTEENERLRSLFGWQCANCKWATTDTGQFQDAVWHYTNDSADLVCPQCGAIGEFVNWPNDETLVDLAAFIYKRRIERLESVPLRAHKVMTREEYNAATVQGWHLVCHNYEGGNTGIKYEPAPLVEQPPKTAKELDAAIDRFRAACGGDVIPELERDEPEQPDLDALIADGNSQAALLESLDYPLHDPQSATLLRRLVETICRLRAERARPEPDLDAIARAHEFPAPRPSDVIGGFPYAESACNGCGSLLTLENAWMTDGCPCNSVLGVNSLNETRWRLLMQLQQQQSHELERRLRAERAPAGAAEGTWTWALEQLKAGNRLRRPGFAKPIYLELNPERQPVLRKIGNRNAGWPWQPYVTDFERTDWQLAPENSE